MLIMVLLIVSCYNNSYIKFGDYDKNIANQEFEKVLNALVKENAEMLKLLFSQETLNTEKEFDNSVEQLFNYFDGEIKSYEDWGGPYVSTVKDDGDVIQIMKSTYDLKTSTCDYRICITYVYKDSTNTNNIGIKSLYIIKAEDDLNLQYAYWGDGIDAPGIHIGVPNIE